MEHLLVVTSSPHIKSSTTTKQIMLDVIIALVPTLIAGSVFYGPKALLCTLVCVVSCVFFEWGTQKVLKRPVTVYDLSAVVTGLILAFNLPATTPLWILPIGAFFAITITKQLFGGLGQNFANPALVARIIIMLSFAGLISDYTAPFAWLGYEIDGVTSATPLSIGDEMTWWQLILGLHGGAFGECCAVTLLLGGLYLSVKKVINPLIPIVFIGTTAGFCAIFGQSVLTTVFSGGLILGAVYMATDYATTPATLPGKLIFSFGCGLLTGLIRCFGSYPEGVSFAILLMNICTPLIDRFTRQKPFGGKR